jgi:hypothetical protein
LPSLSRTQVKYIPKEIDAEDAARDYLDFACENLRSDEYVQDWNAWYLKGINS